MKIEICCASFEAIDFAKQTQVNRMELCSALELGGLTPSLGLLKYALNSENRELGVLIRPRIGSFVYSKSEKAQILSEIQEIQKLGFTEFVVGALTSENDLDLDFLQQIISLNPSCKFTFHRAFDVLRNPFECLLSLIEIGFIRVLTSGGKENSLEGIEQIKEIINIAQDKIEIMIGGGINAYNVVEILENCSPNAIHFSGTEKVSEQKSLFSADKLYFSSEKALEIYNKIKNFGT